LTKQLKRGALVAAPLDQDVQHFPLDINCAPQIHRATANRDKHLIQVPTADWFGTPSLKPLRVGGAELRNPAADRLVADVEATFGQQIFDVPETELEAQIEPHCVLDHARWEVMTGIRDRLHPRTLSAATEQANVPVTEPAALLDGDNVASGVWADTAYRSQANLVLLDRRGLVPQFQRAKPRGKPMPAHIRRGNATRAKARAAVEHVFAARKRRLGLIVRTIGLARAAAKITLANLAYNFTRLAWLQGRTVPA
jgi:hypothetical protein